MIQSSAELKIIAIERLLVCVARFQTTFLGSRAMAGSLLRSGMLQALDRDGRNLSDVLFMHGFDGSDAAVGQIAMRREAVKGCAYTHA